MPGGFGGGVHIIFPPRVGHFILGPLGPGGPEDAQASAAVWARAPWWAHGASGGPDKDSGDPDNPGSMAPGGTFFVGVGGSQFAKKNLFGPFPWPPRF